MTAFEKGMLARLQGKMFNSCPFGKELRVREQWQRGYLFLCQR